MKPYYQESGITIYCGDCREILPELPRDVAVVTDPPYGISHSTHSGDYAIKGNPSWMNQQIEGDDDTAVRDFVAEWSRGLPMAMFGVPRVPRPRPDDIRQVLIWDKGPQSGMGDLNFPWKPSFEEIYIYGDGWTGRRDEGVLKGFWLVTWEAAGRTHQHEKPTALLSHIITKANHACILDPFMGTGATLVAAKKCGKMAIGIEIEEKYCEIAAKRLSQEVFQFHEPTS